MASAIPIGEAARAMPYRAYKRAVWASLVEFWAELAERRPEWSEMCQERLVRCRAELARWGAA